MATGSLLAGESEQSLGFFGLGHQFADGVENRSETDITLLFQVRELAGQFGVLLEHLAKAHEGPLDTVCPACKTPLRLIALIETDATIKKILSAMGLPTEAPKLYPARPPPAESGGEGGDWLN